MADALTLQSNPNKDQFEIVKVGIGQTPAITATNFTTNTYFGGDFTTIPHGLSFSPAVEAYILDTDGVSIIPLPYSDPAAGGTGGGIEVTVFYAYADNVNVYLRVRTVGYGPYFAGNYTVAARNVKYYLKRDRTNQ